MWVCLYIMHKYYSTLEHPKNWKDFAPKELHTKTMKDIGKNFEHIVLKYVCNYRIFRNTLLEVLDASEKINDDNIYNLLLNYVKVENYIGHVDGLYKMVSK